MPIKELFERGLSFTQFVNEDKDAYQEKTLEIYQQIEIDTAVEEEIKKIKEDIYVLVFGEIWCPDCMINVPALQKMSDINPKFHIRIVSREGNESYMENYKINGKPKIPTFVLLDRDFNEIGIFIEQPQMIKEIMAKGKQVEIIVAKRKYRKGEYIIETIKEILEIVKRSS